ncbi:MAG: enoyl-CoA hydratase/isomerase family protein [Chloroflexi bacterium]|nr:enoyl-CoA hydratase/isomerase family protein [Chloroflexota bacterium]
MADYTGYQSLLIAAEDGVATVMLNRPELLNAIDRTMHHDLTRLWDELAEDTHVNAVVLTGAGRAFSAGGDLRRMQARLNEPSENMLHIRRIQREARLLVDRMLDVELPIIGAVNGAATGLGATIALFCDVVFAADTAKFGDTHVRAGLVAGDGGAVIWPLLVGMQKAKHYLFTGDLIDAAQAKEMGLVHQVTTAEELLPAATAYARKLADGPTWAIRWTKVSLNKWLKFGTGLVLPTSLGLEGLSMASADHKEAVASFLEKRRPTFRGE